MFALPLREAINILCHFSSTLIKELYSEMLHSKLQEAGNSVHNEEEASLIKFKFWGCFVCLELVSAALQPASCLMELIMLL